jgi:hypothetical protein
VARFYFREKKGFGMSKVEMLSAKLDTLNQQIEDVSSQRIILSLTHPLAERHRRLVQQRARVEAELKKLNHNVIEFPRMAPA